MNEFNTTEYLRGEGWLVVKTIVLSLAGFPDIFAFRNKVAIFIEVKSPKGKLPFNRTTRN